MWRLETELPIQLAVIQVEDIRVSEDKTAFMHLSQCARVYKSRYEGKTIGDIDGVQTARRLFRNLGIDPTKHRPSSEALLNRAIKGKELYSVNTLVDVGNWCSLDFLLPTSVYDADKIVGEVVVRKGKENESYMGLNKRVVNLYNRYVISDESGAFGSPITDSQRTSVTFATKKAFLVIFAPRDYEPELLNKQAEVFADRVQDICGGVLKNIGILSDRRRPG